MQLCYYWEREWDGDRGSDDGGNREVKVYEEDDKEASHSDIWRGKESLKHNIK